MKLIIVYVSGTSYIIIARDAQDALRIIRGKNIILRDTAEFQVFDITRGLKQVIT
jgi:hypothetical protein